MHQCSSQTRFKTKCIRYRKICLVKLGKDQASCFFHCSHLRSEAINLQRYFFTYSDSFFKYLYIVYTRIRLNIYTDIPCRCENAGSCVYRRTATPMYVLQMQQASKLGMHIKIWPHIYIGPKKRFCMSWFDSEFSHTAARGAQIYFFHHGLVSTDPYRGG